MTTIEAPAAPSADELEALLEGEPDKECELAELVLRWLFFLREEDCHRRADWIAHCVPTCSGHIHPAALFMCDQHLTQLVTGLLALTCHICNQVVRIGQTEWLR